MDVVVQHRANTKLELRLSYLRSKTDSQLWDLLVKKLGKFVVYVRERSEWKNEGAKKNEREIQSEGVKGRAKGRVSKVKE